MVKFSKKMIAIYSAVIFFVILDRFLKNFVLLEPGQQFNLIGGALKFSFRFNRYIAFSLPVSGAGLSMVILLIIITLIWLSLSYWRQGDNFKFSSLVLIIFGASSNLWDRIWQGAVIDYLDLKYFTVFNLADVMIVIGIVLLIISNYKKEAG